MTKTLTVASALAGLASATGITYFPTGSTPAILLMFVSFGFFLIFFILASVQANEINK